MEKSKIKLKKGSPDMAQSSSTAADRKKALAAALTQIERSFGKGSIMRLGDGTVLDRKSVV